MKDKYILGHPDAFKHANEAFEWFKENYHHRYGTIREHDGLVEIHTGGWSENETLVEELKKTAWWLLHFRAMTTGGHYYFDTTGELDRWEVKLNNI
jgi:hypothetical protein